MRAAILVCACLLTACGDEPAPRSPATTKVASLSPSWADVFDGVPDLYAVVRPRALKRDSLYGALWKSMMSAAEARGVMQGATMVEAVDGAEEIIVGLGAGVDGALVLRGVPASLDPARIRDAKGRPIFRPRSDRTRVAEYELIDEGRPNANANREGGAEGSLFVLPDRTWVGALGEARRRARQAYGGPGGGLHRPSPTVDAEALATVRVAGALAHALDRSPLFGPLGRRLVSATFSVMPGKAGLIVALAYEDGGAAAQGEQSAKDVAAALIERDRRWVFLKDATIRYEGTTVTLRVALPPRLLEELPKASMADFFGEF
jgi:hypothetical protein